MRVEYSKGTKASAQLIQLRREESEALNGGKSKIMLVFPPDWYPSEPYLSLPTLTAVLRAAGHHVVQKDVNLEMYDWYFSEDFLKRVLRKVPQQLDRLRKISKRRDLEDWEHELQLALCDLTRDRIAELTKKAERAKEITRSGDFYDSDKLEWAINTFREVTAVISLVYARSSCSRPELLSPCGGQV